MYKEYSAPLQTAEQGKKHHPNNKYNVANLMVCYFVLYCFTLTRSTNRLRKAPPLRKCFQRWLVTYCENSHTCASSHLSKVPKSTGVSKVVNTSPHLHIWPPSLIDFFKRSLWQSSKYCSQLDIKVTTMSFLLRLSFKQVLLTAGGISRRLSHPTVGNV